MLAAKERKRARRLAKKSRVRSAHNSSCDITSSQTTIAGSPPQPQGAAATDVPPAPAGSPARSSSMWRSSSAFTTPPPRYDCLRTSRPAPSSSQETCCASPDVVVTSEVRPKEEEEATPRASLPREAKAVFMAVEKEPRSPPYWRLATAQWRGMRARRAADIKKRPPAVADIRLSASARAADASRRKWLIQREIADQWLSKRRLSPRSSHRVQGDTGEGEGGDETAGGECPEAQLCERVSTERCGAGRNRREQRDWTEAQRASRRQKTA